LAAARQLSEQPGLRCVVLTGAGRAFMAGGDVASMAGSPEHAAQVGNALLGALNPAMLLLRRLDAPGIAAVKGAAAGAVLGLALMPARIVAEGTARFLIACDGIGAVPECGGSGFLPHRIGAGRAAEMMLLSRALSAAEAKQWGMVTEVAATGQFSEVLA